MSLNDSHFDILVVLHPHAKHGYAMVQDIEKLHDGAYKPSIGMLYVGLQKLMTDGLIEDAPAPSDNTDPRRKFYQLTALGKATVHEEYKNRMDFLKRAKRLLTT